jgi:hypothetical protein
VGDIKNALASKLSLLEYDSVTARRKGVSRGDACAEGAVFTRILS